MLLLAHCGTVPARWQLGVGGEKALAVAVIAAMTGRSELFLMIPKHHCSYFQWRLLFCSLGQLKKACPRVQKKVQFSFSHAPPVETELTKMEANISLYGACKSE